MNEKKRTMTKMVAEGLILAKLYKDGLFIVDETKRMVKVDARRSRLVKLYQESSYADIKSVIDRTVEGLRMAGYIVSVQWLDGMSPLPESKIQQDQGDLDLNATRGKLSLKNVDALARELAGQEETDG